jgi:putative exporter of polyketide antibiotics
MSVFLVVRHTRGDEEAGRLELVRSARVGRQAPLTSALAVAALANAVLVALLCLVLPVLGLPATGSVALALAIGTCGLAFTGVSLVAAQLTSGARAARGLAIGALGVAFLARAVGDATGASGPSWLTWVLPLGWTETLRPFAGERWWVLALFLGSTGLAFSLAKRRDLGAGLVQEARRSGCWARAWPSSRRPRSSSASRRWPTARYRTGAWRSRGRRWGSPSCSTSSARRSSSPSGRLTSHRSPTLPGCLAARLAPPRCSG